MKKHFLTFLACALALLSGCIPKYTPHTIKSLTKIMPFEEQRKKVTIRVQRLRARDIQTMFDGRGRKLFRRNKVVYPIQISIQNNSERAWCLDSEHISLEQVEHRCVTHFFYTNTGITTLLSALGLTATGCIIFGCVAVDFFTHGAITSAVVTPTLIAGVGNGIFWSSYRSLMYYHADKANKMVAKDLEKKMLIKPLIVWPGQTVDTIIFVKKKNFHHNFNIMLHDPSYQQAPLTYAIKLDENNT